MEIVDDRYIVADAFGQAVQELIKQQIDSNNESTLGIWRLAQEEPYKDSHVYDYANAVMVSILADIPKRVIDILQYNKTKKEAVEVTKSLGAVLDIDLDGDDAGNKHKYVQESINIEIAKQLINSNDRALKVLNLAKDVHINYYGRDSAYVVSVEHTCDIKGETPTRVIVISTPAELQSILNNIVGIKEDSITVVIECDNREQYDTASIVAMSKIFRADKQIVYIYTIMCAQSPAALYDESVVNFNLFTDFPEIMVQSAFLEDTLDLTKDNYNDRVLLDSYVDNTHHARISSKEAYLQYCRTRYRSMIVADGELLPLGFSPDGYDETAVIFVPAVEQSKINVDDLPIMLSLDYPSVERVLVIRIKEALY